MLVFPPPFFSCVKFSFFLYKSCVKLPVLKQHLLTHLPKTHNTRLIVITSICLHRIIMKMSKNLFFSFFSQLGACIMIAQLTRDQRHTQISNWETTILKSESASKIQFFRSIYTCTKYFTFRLLIYKLEITIKSSKHFSLTGLGVDQLL